MDLNTALNILGLKNSDVSEDIVIEAYNRKRAEFLLLSEKKDDEINKYSEIILDAKKIVLSEIGKRKKTLLVKEGVNKINLIDKSLFNYESPEENEEVICPNCGFINQEGRIICKNCNIQMFRPCPKCGHLVKINQEKCDKCKTYIREYDMRKFSRALEAEQRTKSEREIIRIEKEQTEKRNRQFIALGLIHWLIIIFILFVLCLIIINIVNNNHLFFTKAIVLYEVS